MCWRIFSSTLNSSHQPDVDSRLAQRDLHGTQIVRVGHEKVLLALGKKLVKNTRVEEGVVQVTVTRGIPVLLVIIGTLGAGQEGFFQDARVSRLVEGSDPQLLIGVLFDDTQSVIVGVEGGHEDKGDVDAISGVKMLDLTNSKIKESHVVLDLESTLRTGHTY